MIKAMTAVLAISMSVAALPAGAAERQAQGQQVVTPGSEAKADSLGGGKACKDGKCGSKSRAKRGMEGCCCAGMMAKNMDMTGGHDDMDMGHDGGTDHAAMMERMRLMEERMEMMQRMMREQKPHS